MMQKNTVTVLMRPRCRIPFAEPDETGSNWKSMPRIIVAESGVIADYSTVDLAPPKTEIRAMAGENALYLRFDCALDDRRRLTPSTPAQPLSELERAWVHIYPQNDPVERLRFEADFKGMTSVTKHRRMPGERSLGAVADLWQTSSPVTAEWTVFYGLGATSWWVEMEIPWESLHLRARPSVIGFECGRIYNTGQKGIPQDDLSWPSSNRDSTCERVLEPGEALLGPDAGAPAGVEFTPRYGKNRGRLILGDLWPAQAKLLHVRTESGDGTLIAEEDYQLGPAAAATPTNPQAGSKAIEFDFWLDRSLCSHLDVFTPQRLVLEAKGSEGTVLYTARLPMDRHLGVCVDEPYGERGTIEPMPRRSLTRREQMLDRAARSLPRLERRTTAQGAPSDFCITDEAGRMVVNLMADDAWPRLASLVEERFQTTEERLIGALALAGQKSVTNLFLCHMFFNANMEQTYKHGNLHDKMGPLSILRYGGGPAVARAIALARLLQQIRNPDTSKPFVTRALSLQIDGGPKLAWRHDPFWQKAGPVGAVAVEYGSDHTLLDPTTLAFFAKADGKLATLDEILADEKLRIEGAGRMATVFAEIDADDVRHEQPNRRWSKGVFPELCPDEDRPDRPFDPRERQVPRVILPGPPIEGFTDAFEQRGRRDGSVQVRCGKRGLSVCVQVRGVNLATLADRDREVEQVHLAIDAEHGHFRFHHFMVGTAGEQKLWRDQVTNIQTLFKHLSTEQSSGTEISGAGWMSRLVVSNDGYERIFEIPWDVIGVKQPPPVIGLNVWIQGRVPHYEQLFLVPPRWHIAPDPFHFADAYLSDAPVTLSEIDLGIPTWGENTGRVRLVNSGNREIGVTLQAENRLGKRRSVTRSREMTATIPPNGTKAMEFPFFINPEEKSGAQNLDLVGRVAGDEFFRARWKVEYGGPVSVYHRYGSAIGKVAEPKPGQPDFLNQKICYICSRIPQFQRLTTRDGAASDFVLRVGDGSVEFNLMQAGVLDRICAYIAGLFDNDLDRILGIYYFSHAPFFARHMSWGHRIMEGADPLSVIRGNFAGGGGNCGYHSRVFGGLASHLKLNGQYLSAHGSVGVYGHVISAVARRGSKAIIDADVGHFFLSPDGLDLATIEELRANPDILTTAGPGDLARYYTVNDEAVRIRKGMLHQSVKGSFPSGAPQR